MDRRRANVPPFSPPSSEPGFAARTLDPPEGTALRPDALLPGTRLEEFEIERVIGSSGFGLVYLANDEAFERRVAIKEYLPDTLAVRGDDGLQVLLRAPSHAEAFERGRRAFIEEAHLLARCNHASLLHVLRQWEAHGTVYRVMPHYPGHSLLALRQALDAPPDEASLRALLEGLLDALVVLHDAGSLHREIAPAKILLLPDDRPVLMGPSAERRAIVGDQARALMTLLTPSFAPLEQTAPALDRPLGPWTDLYALAAVVRYCLSGELPPPTSLYATPPREPMHALAQRVRTAYPHLHYSASFLSAIDAALASRPEDRPQDVAEFRDLLDDHPPAWGERTERADREEPSLAPLSGEAPAEAEDQEAERTLGPFYAPTPDTAAPARPDTDTQARPAAPEPAAPAPSPEPLQRAEPVQRAEAPARAEAPPPRAEPAQRAEPPPRAPIATAAPALRTSRIRPPLSASRRPQHQRPSASGRRCMTIADWPPTRRCLPSWTNAAADGAAWPGSAAC